MNWFDNDFFKALEMMGLVQANEDLRKKMNEPTNEELTCERLRKERDYWKELFEKEHETNKKLRCFCYNLLTKERSVKDDKSI